MFEECLQKTVPLVLHRITSPNQAQLFEDVDRNIFDYLITKIGSETTTLSSQNGSLDDSEFKFLLTFDDGHESDYTQVLPCLQKYNSKAIFFIITDFIGCPGYMNWQEVARLYDAGMEIGSHSRSHINFVETKSSVLEEELSYSKKYIEDKIGSQVTSFSFPYGSYAKTHVEMALESGFSNIFASHHGVITRNQCPFPRNSINQRTTISDIDRICAPDWQKRCSWFIEDLAKKSIKNVIGNKRYKSLRNKIAGS